MLREKEFDAKTVALEGTNLVEASAGTGKTYSIALLYLRLLVERSIQVSEILMVTFTNAAVGELETRVRAFVRTAKKAAAGIQIQDENISSIISAAQETYGSETVLKRMEEAVILLDEIEIYSIHGFCNKILSEFSLETGVGTGAELLEDIQLLIGKYLNEFWRKHITTLDPEVLKPLITNEKGDLFTDGFKKTLQEVVADHLAGKTYHCYQEQTIYEVVPDAEGLICFAIQEVSAAVIAHKESRNVLSYDDQIAKLHQALQGQNRERLIRSVKSRYKAVFADEFQDTDRLQYEILESFFGTDTLLFFIGDPKQSIYAWRKADLDTYFKARSWVDHVYTMNTNFRSSARLINELNTFFLPYEGFDSFYFQGAPDEKQIKYKPVIASPVNKDIRLIGNDKELPALVLQEFDTGEPLKEAVVQDVQQLLSGRYFLEINGIRRPVAAKDITILIRSGSQGEELMNQFSALNIPANYLKEKKILESQEAREMIPLIRAIDAPDRSSINEVLISRYINLPLQEVLKLEDEKLLLRFEKYKDIWMRNGIYPALMAFAKDFNLQTKMAGRTEGGKRALANFFHLTELIHKQQQKKNLTGAELISWIQRGTEGQQVKGNEFVQRLETDDDGVTIMTIHKSKGLEFNILLAPFLDFKFNKKRNKYVFKDNEGTYRVASGTILKQRGDIAEWCQTQEEQENRRLLYVTLTRAAAQCFIYHTRYGNKDRKKQQNWSTLTRFLDAHPYREGLIYTPETGEPISVKQSNRSEEISYHTDPVNFNLLQPDWRRLSYTYLAQKGETEYKKAVFNENSSYDQFIFNELIRGARAGNILHDLFEQISFDSEQRWERALDHAVKYFPGEQKEKLKEQIYVLLKHVLSVEIEVEGTQLKLQDIDWQNKIAEFEFDFPVQPVAAVSLADMLRDTYGITLREDLTAGLEGVMNGKIDLFFRYEGKYYILDWKSNYLGSTIEDYSRDNIAKAMTDANYHLQYLIYCLAVKKYLSSRVSGFSYERDFGGVIYLFVRGVREGKDSGIFTTKPSGKTLGLFEELINKNPDQTKLTS